VVAAARQHVGRAAVADQASERTIHTLGSAGGAELLLAQAGEQGAAATAGMLATALSAIRRCRPDHVILTGICHGLRPDEGQRTGDIVIDIGAHLRPASAERRPPQGDRRQVIHRGVNVGCSPVLLDRSRPACRPGPALARASARR
jgi:nucleoside phosphorylase